MKDNQIGGNQSLGGDHIPVAPNLNQIQTDDNVTELVQAGMGCKNYIFNKTNKKKENKKHKQPNPELTCWNPSGENSARKLKSALTLNTLINRLNVFIHSISYSR